MSATDAFEELDKVAKVNLTDAAFKEYLHYKAELIADATDVLFIKDVLRGFIWGEIEGEITTDEGDQ